MRIALASDLHVDFDDYGDLISPLIDSRDFDVLCIAGDLAEVRDSRWHKAITSICWNADPNPVLYVAGNHEFYGARIEETKKAIREKENLLPNLHFLDEQIFVVDGQRFLGTTLWYTNPETLKWSDFRAIENFNFGTVKDLAKKARDFLASNMQEGDVVLTHMLPSPLCTHTKWIGNRSNCFFVHNIEELIIERNPKLMCFGHTHETMNERLGDTRLISNPRGIAYETAHENWKPLIITI